MQKIIFILTLSSLVACRSITQPELRREAASVTQKTGRHFIITVHGLGGGPQRTRFNQLDENLVKHLKALKPDLNYQALDFEYPSGISNQSSFDFAYVNFRQFLREKIKDPQPNDSINIIAHSQGGVITSLWKLAVTYDMFKYHEDIKLSAADKMYGQITDQIVFMAVPFWGTNVAKLGLDLKLKKAGFKTELRMLSFNSDAILWLRRAAIALNQNTASRQADNTSYTNIAAIFPNEKSRIFYDKQLAGTSPTHIAGSIVASLFNGIIKRHSFSSEAIGSKSPDRYESDLTVPVPSSKSLFLHAQKKMTCDENELNVEKFGQAELFPNVKYILTESAHSSVIPSPRTIGIANVPGFCGNPAICQHPTYRYVLKALAQCDKSVCEPGAVKGILDTMDELKRQDAAHDEILTTGVDLQAFVIDINLKMPTEYNFASNLYRQNLDTENVTGFDEDGETIEVERVKSYEPLRQEKSKLDDPRFGGYRVKSRKVLKKIVKILEDRLPAEQRRLFELKVMRSRERYSGTACFRDSLDCDPNSLDLRFHITGILKPLSLKIATEEEAALAKMHLEGLNVPLEISMPDAPGYKPVRIVADVKVTPGKASFVDLDLRESLKCDR